MIGDHDDIVFRLRTVLPSRWFGDSSPILGSLLQGLAAGWSWVYGLVGFTVSQTRISTATDLWLDLIASDLFGPRLHRRGNEPDNVLRSRIQTEIIRERGTRQAIIAAVTDLTGVAPTVFEPARPGDTGAWGFGTAYGIAGGWGSLSLPFQCFVVAHRPQGHGVAQVAGWGSSIGAYGEGQIEYASIEMSEGQVSDSDIYGAIANVLPVACTAWTRITN